MPERQQRPVSSMEGEESLVVSLWVSILCATLNPEHFSNSSWKQPHSLPSLLFDCNSLQLSHEGGGWAAELEASCLPPPVTISHSTARQWP